MNKEPKRLFEMSDADPELRADLDRARRGDPAGYDVAAGLAAFEASLGSAPAGGTEAATAASTGKTLTWVIAAVVGAASAGAIAWAVAGDGGDAAPRGTVYGQAAAEHHPADPASEPTPADPTPEHDEPEPEQGDAEPEQDEPAPEPGPADPGPDADEAAELDTSAHDGSGHEAAAPPTNRAPRARPKPRARPPGGAPRPEPAPDRVAAEIRATQAAKSKLASNPGQALNLARQADRDFPGGLFKQDRRAIVVLALFGLGRHGEATAKAKAYLKRHPKGTFAEKIRARMKNAEG